MQRDLACKRRHALDYWVQRVREEGTLANEHYEEFYTSHFGLDRDFYCGKRVLDIGCGPRGSLEWADMVDERVGLDPLADKYRQLGTHQHKTSYVNASAEEIPFPDAFFDVVCSFNSLDHVDDITQTVSEIIRVIRGGGLLLVLTAVHSKPTIREPQTFRWEVVKRFAPPMTLVRQRRLEFSAEGIYASVREGIEFDETDNTDRKGVLCAQFAKPL